MFGSQIELHCGPSVVMYAPRVAVKFGLIVETLPRARFHTLLVFLIVPRVLIGTHTHIANGILFGSYARRGRHSTNYYQHYIFYGVL